MSVNEHGGMEFRILVPEEKKRTYYFSGCTLMFYGVKEVCVRPSGTHRLIVDPKLNRGEKLIIVNAGWLVIGIDSDEWTF